MSPFEPVLDKKQAPAIVEPGVAMKIRYWFGWFVPEEHRGWIERDIASRSFLWRRFTIQLASALAVWSLFDAFITRFEAWPFLLGTAIGGVGAVTFFGDFQRQRTLEWHEKRWKRIRERDEGPDLRRFP